MHIKVKVVLEILEFIFDLGVEILFDSYLDIALSVIPQNKHNEKLEINLIIFFSCVTTLFLVLFCVGLYMTTKPDSPHLLTKIFLLLAPVQLALSVILYIVRKLVSIVRKITKR